MDNNNINVRVYPLEDPKGKMLAYANIALDNIAAVKGLRIVDGKNGIFVSMPQSQDRQGMYHDIAFPLSKELRDKITEAVVTEFDRQMSLPEGERGYEKEDHGPGRSIDVSLDSKVFPLKDPKGDTLAFANVGFDNAFVIRGIRIKETDKGKSVTMPQSKDKDGNLHDVAYPLSSDLYVKISRKVLDEYKTQIETRRQSIEGKLAEGFEKTMQYAQGARPQPSMAKSSPGLGD